MNWFSKVWVMFWLLVAIYFLATGGRQAGAYNLLGSERDVIIGTALEFIVIDGDTLRIGSYMLRISGIDAPEMSQPGGNVARGRMRHHVAHATVITCRFSGKDRHRRYIATCFNLHGHDLADLIVREGYAFAYIKFSRNYVLAEEYAKKNRRGLWAHDGVVMPWTWRATRRQ